MRKCNFITTTGDRCLSYVFTDPYQEKKCIQGHRTEGFTVNPLDLVPKQPILMEVPYGTDPANSERRQRKGITSIRMSEQRRLEKLLKADEISHAQYRKLQRNWENSHYRKVKLDNMISDVSEEDLDRKVYYFTGNWYKELKASIWHLEEMKEISRVGFNKFPFTNTFTQLAKRNHSLVIAGSEFLMKYLEEKPYVGKSISQKEINESPHLKYYVRNQVFFKLEDIHKTGLMTIAEKRMFEDYFFENFTLLTEAEKNKKIKKYKSKVSWTRSQLIPRIIKTCIATYVKDFKDPDLLTRPIRRDPNYAQKILDRKFSSNLYGMKSPIQKQELVV
ncbi:MAG: hypothetical protein AAEC03_10260 [Synechococcus sp.]